MKLFWFLAVVHSALCHSHGRTNGGGGVDISLGPFVIRAGGGGGGGGFGGFYLGTQSPDGVHTPLIDINAGGGGSSFGGGGGSSFGGGGGDSAFVAGGGGGGAGGVDRTGAPVKEGGGFGGVSIGNFLRVLGWGGGQARGAVGGGGGARVVVRRQAEETTTTAATTTAGSLFGGGGGSSGGGGGGGFNISGLFGAGGLSELGLGGPEPDPRFRAPGQSPEEALQFNYDERPKYDQKGNVITPINSRYQILKAKFVPDDVTTTKSP